MTFDLSFDAMVETASDVFRTPRAPSPARHALGIIMNADDPKLPPSRHLLDGIDVVRFARGHRAATRDHADGMSRLTLHIPDRVMSADHGRLLRVQGQWLFEDQHSKNGAMLAGRTTRCAMMAPGDLLELGHTLLRLDAFAMDSTEADTILAAEHSVPELASLHPALVVGARALARIAPTDIPVLLHGETGSGKEVYARALHTLSARSGDLISIACSSASPKLIEEAFAARAGTVFLDRIGELPTESQAAMLCALDTTRIRVCAANEHSLTTDVESGRFRSDLCARLLGYQLGLPPLRERLCDLGQIVANLLVLIAPGDRVTFTPAAARALVLYSWPRNVRELERCLVTANMLACDHRIDVKHLSEDVRRCAARFVDVRESSPPAGVEDEALRSQLAAKMIEHHGNISAVARALGKHREQVQRWIKRLGIDPGLFRR